MCFSLPSPARSAEGPMEVSPATNFVSETLCPPESVGDCCDHSGRLSAVGESTLPVGYGVCGEDAAQENCNTDTQFRQLNNDSTLLLTSCSPVSAVAPESWVTTQGNWLLDENEGSMGAESVFAIGPSNMGAGLSNLGNTCFLNAILQCFTHTVPLVQGIRACTHNFPCPGHMDRFCVICTFRDQVERSLSACGRTLSPLKFVNNLSFFSSGFRRYQQEDAHEFMQCALDKLERCFLDLKKTDLNFEDDNLVQKVFGGRLISKLQCCSCGCTSDTYEPLIDMSLEIESVDSLPSALESFTKVEKIDANFRCDSCKEEVSMEKQLMLDLTPSIAAFHLKRFKTDGILVEKIDKHIDFPLELDLQPYTISNQNNDVLMKYDLYAIVVHTGFSSTSGHYFCFIRSGPDTWHKLDDSMVTEVSGDSVRSQEAYILFYARQGTPWFSSIMESQKQCLDPNISSTSPTSVLDVGDDMAKSNPSFVPSTEEGGAGVSKGCSDPPFDYFCSDRLAFSETNDTKDATHGCGQLLYGSNQESISFHSSSKDVETQKFSRNRVTLDGRSMIDGKSYTENASLDNNYDCEEVVDLRESACSLSLPSPPPTSPLDDASDKFRVLRDKSKESKQSRRRPLNQCNKDPERQEAVKYLNKTGSRRGELLKYVQDGASNKRKKVDSLQCKKTTSLDRKKSNQTSVSRPVAAGISQ
ncbi:hypothetical protein LR48_Vigan07g128200 [Vigna angularis]|uniref:Ubiquitin carboxyl-terminal hydrolase n=2 Tax=Phaseolus angularis TaxID=3914 RepID=A0A0L9UXT6_PHAAN|nr:ubiquitin carboxyl-terminal hydrolase 21 isoform X1 [Vigna angularis]KAG2376706.1 Ubiquitin carboxyl-terminal hydrolase [Vigna angularis]KOM47578.1 hypothetical protein LR48_Vigan07g128200 [Vigna angularis]BAT99376.1 hypothetical protein VIGAN_10080000 [Vigna angularis var. angularis]